MIQRIVLTCRPANLPVGTVRAYDTRACYQSILDPDAVATIPPRRNARLRESVDPPDWRAMRDAHLGEIKRLGLYEWRYSGCSRQSLAENAK